MEPDDKVFVIICAMAFLFLMSLVCAMVFNEYNYKDCVKTSATVEIAALCKN